MCAFAHESSRVRETLEENIDASVAKLKHATTCASDLSCAISTLSTQLASLPSSNATDTTTALCEHNCMLHQMDTHVREELMTGIELSDLLGDSNVPNYASIANDEIMLVGMLICIYAQKSSSLAGSRILSGQAGLSPR